MELILAAAVGAVGGWLLSRRERTTSDTAGSVRGRRRPTKRQRAILATLPPDSPSPSIDDLMRE